MARSTAHRRDAQFALRLVRPRPSRPRPSSASVPGSATDEIGTRLKNRASALPSNRMAASPTKPGTKSSKIVVKAAGTGISIVIDSNPKGSVMNQVVKALIWIGSALEYQKPFAASVGGVPTTPEKLKLPPEVSIGGTKMVVERSTASRVRGRVRRRGELKPHSGRSRVSDLQRLVGTEVAGQCRQRTGRQEKSRCRFHHEIRSACRWWLCRQLWPMSGLKPQPAVQRPPAQESCSSSFPSAPVPALMQRDRLQVLGHGCSLYVSSVT